MRVLFFSPYAYVNVWAYPEAVIAENFRQRGHEIFQIRCNGLYSDFCIAMSAINLTPRSSEDERLDVCRECKGRRELIEKQFGFQTYGLDDYVTQDDRARVEARLKQVTQANWTEIEFDGIAVPRFAAYEYLLNEKICTTTFKEEQWPGFMTHVKNALLTMEAGRKLFNDIEPDAILAYNTNYGCNHVMCALAEARGIPHYKEHQGRHHKRMLSEMTIFRGFVDNLLVNRCEAWRKLRDRPLKAADVELAYEHIAELLEATSPWVYSIKSDNRSPEALREFFGITTQKVALVTMSSADETFAARLADVMVDCEPPMFPTQDTWIQALVEWARHRPEVFLIIRVHPREFPNKRETVLSTNAQRLREALVDLPPNCRVNWPDDAISLHDVAKIADVGLNATSTAGLELLLLGLPVVIYDLQQFIAYPAELNICARSIEDYWSKVETALHAGRSMAHVIGAFRWIAFLSTVMAIDVGDNYGTQFEQHWEPPPPHRPSAVMRWKERILGRRSTPEPALAPDDPFLNPKGVRHIANGRWLAYAVEHQTISHMDALVEEILDTAAPSSDVEQAVVAAAAKRYCDKVGLSNDLFAPQTLGPTSSDENQGALASG